MKISILTGLSTCVQVQATYLTKYNLTSRSCVLVTCLTTLSLSSVHQIIVIPPAPHQNLYQRRQEIHFIIQNNAMIEATHKMGQRHEMSAKDLLQEMLEGSQPATSYMSRVKNLTNSYIETECAATKMSHTGQMLGTFQSTTEKGFASSSAFVVVLSDIYEIIRTENRRKPVTTWIAPATFERAGDHKVLVSTGTMSFKRRSRGAFMIVSLLLPFQTGSNAAG